jgi:hypothetical protein
MPHPVFLSSQVSGATILWLIGTSEASISFYSQFFPLHSITLGCIIMLIFLVFYCRVVSILFSIEATQHAKFAAIVIVPLWHAAAQLGTLSRWPSMCFVFTLRDRIPHPVKPIIVGPIVDWVLPEDWPVHFPMTRGISDYIGLIELLLFLLLLLLLLLLFSTFTGPSMEIIIF